MATIICVFITAVVSLAADEPKDKQKDQDRIQGTWQVQSGERGGNPLPEELVKNGRLVVSGDKLTMKRGDRTNELTFKLAPDKNPKEIDVESNGQTGLGIYELDKDTLKIVHGDFGSPRPKEMPKKGSEGVTVMVFKRVKN